MYDEITDKRGSATLSDSLAREMKSWLARKLKKGESTEKEKGEKLYCEGQRERKVLGRDEGRYLLLRLK